MSAEQLTFYILSASALVSALMVVSIKNLVRSIFLFFVTLFSVAGIYVFSLADFVAITQVVIYVGGVLVLMLFAFMLSSKELLNGLEKIKTKLFQIQTLPGIVIAIAFFAVLVNAILNAGIEHAAWLNDYSNHLKVTDNTIPIIGINLMTRYLLPFEMVSILLMMALIGAAHLARKEKKI